MHVLYPLSYTPLARIAADSSWHIPSIIATALVSMNGARIKPAAASLVIVQFSNRSVACSHSDRNVVPTIR